MPHADGNMRPVKETAGVLLRILLLAPGPRVPVDGAAAVMRIAKAGFGQYVAQLRHALGNDELVDRSGGVVQYTGDRTQSDAAIIERKHDEILKAIDGDEVITAALAARILPTLLEIRGLYVGNPAMGLSGFQLADVPPDCQQWAIELDDVTSDWMQRWSSVQLMLADCLMLTSPGRTTGRSLLKELLKIARNPDPAEEVFPRLLKAAGMSGDVRQHRNAWDLTQRFYEHEQMEFPPELEELAPTVQKIANTPWAPHRARPLQHPLEYGSGTDDAIHDIARLLGITSVLKLRGAEVEPAECIERTTRRLYFSGVLASKWVCDAGVRSDFERLLTRLDSAEGDGSDVRFLIIDPDGDAYNQLYQLRGGRLSKESVPLLQELAVRHRSFRVRVVNALPAFRIVVIDDDFVTFSPYAIEGERYATSKLGWEAPHVMLDPLAPYPLADAFRLYFEERWASANDLDLSRNLPRRSTR
ncbi:hypothetical protein Drose_37130 [Dactylosporangium roseum]|uniref:Uncharacterized protein n=1 Tax=Dactylosporangium roseum TaxID=47989 RepID=A0ABY5Z766_9ACTN|nr:hypothetical protein [Dactylosporangium roseum]UWZ36573.1 hypothetical protein Drose_37130 [Dactylosporangium roseum]